jgi:LAGLIDADG endonuclease
LHYIKKQLGFGSIFLDNKGKCEFRIRDRKIIQKVLIPIFDRYPLLTYKYFFYLQFKEVCYILENKNLTIEQKNETIKNILNSPLPPYYISPTIFYLSEKSNFEEISSVISKQWLIGFVEAVTIFSIVNETGSFSLKFTIVQKQDKLLLQLIKRILHAKNIIYESNNNCYVLTTKNSRAIFNIINLFTKKFKGMKSLNFKLWSRANLYKKNTNKIVKISRILTNLNNKIKHSTITLNVLSKRSFSTTRNS